jgi:hypothetical protein
VRDGGAKLQVDLLLLLTTRGSAFSLTGAEVKRALFSCLFGENYDSDQKQQSPLITYPDINAFEAMTATHCPQFKRKTSIAKGHMRVRQPSSAFPRPQAESSSPVGALGKAAPAAAGAGAGGGRGGRLPSLHTRKRSATHPVDLPEDVTILNMVATLRV